MLRREVAALREQIACLSPKKRRDETAGSPRTLNHMLRVCSVALVRALSYCRVRDVLATLVTCKRLYGLSKENSLWESVCETLTRGWSTGLLRNGTHKDLVKRLIKARVVFPRGRFSLLFDESKERLVFSNVRYSEEASLRVCDFPDIYLKCGKRVRYFEVSVPTTPVNERRIESMCFQDDDTVEESDDNESARDNDFGCLSIGVASKKMSLLEIPGYEGDATSISYDGDNGMKYISSLEDLHHVNKELVDAGTQFAFGPTFGKPGDVIGCGVLFLHSSKESEDVKETGENTRLCRNCGFPGHRFRRCFFPRRCFVCGSTAHESRNCDERRNRAVRCTLCSSSRHTNAMCPVKRRRRLLDRHYVFFTLNGTFLGAAFCCHSMEDVLPIVGFQDFGLPVQINHGRQPFCFDLSMLFADEIDAICHATSEMRVVVEEDEDDMSAFLSDDSWETQSDDGDNDDDDDDGNPY